MPRPTITAQDRAGLTAYLRMLSDSDSRNARRWAKAQLRHLNDRHHRLPDRFNLDHAERIILGKSLLSIRDDPAVGDGAREWANERLGELCDTRRHDEATWREIVGRFHALDSQ